MVNLVNVPIYEYQDVNKNLSVTAKKTENDDALKLVFVYTMFRSLGDFIIMGDLVHKIDKVLPNSKCLVAHRDNPHVKRWRYDHLTQHFFNIYRIKEFLNFISQLKKRKEKGATIFGLQQAPGSLQGFIFLWTLRRFGLIDYIVDFNLYNADIITPPCGQYILDLHLNQIQYLFKIDIPQDYYQLKLPFSSKEQGQGIPIIQDNIIRIGIHPWSSRGHLSCFIWSLEKWSGLIQLLLQDKSFEIIIFGRDQKFEPFKKYLRETTRDNLFSRIKFEPNSTIYELTESIKRLDLLLSVNTSVVHIGYALDKKMIILVGPTLKFWVPKGNKIISLSDKKATLPGSDKYFIDARFPSVDRIEVKEVFEAVLKILEMPRA